MAHFLIEFRLRGHAKEYARWARTRTIREARKLRVRRQKQAKFVPHITLFGRADTHNIKNVVREVERVCQKYTRIPFELGVKRGEFQKEDANWLYLDVEPSPELEQFRYELAQSLLGLESKIHATCRPHDRKSKCKFHCSIGKYERGSSAEFQKLSDYAENECSFEAFRQHKAPAFGKLLNIIRKHIFGVEEDNDPAISQHLLRVTVLGRRNRIQSEYDLVLGKMLSRRQALSRYWWRKTIEKLRELRSTPPEERPSISNKSIYLISDTHFDHKNIIRYCHRPFSNVSEMNRVMVKKWNSAVGDNELVYFLGDWAFGRRSRPATYWKQRLKGNIIAIKGSHDKIKFEASRVLHVGGYSFLLIHNPRDEKIEWLKWHGWIIHGHVHHHAPFIDGKKKRINVSVEAIDYRPVSLEYLLSLDLDSIKQMRTIDSQPERW